MRSYNKKAEMTGEVIVKVCDFMNASPVEAYIMYAC